MAKTYTGKATNNPDAYGVKAKDLIVSGASPRAAIFLFKAAKITAVLHGRAWLSPEDLHSALRLRTFPAMAL